MKLTIHFRVITLAMLVLGLSSRTVAQVTLQKWTEVFGAVPGQSLGRYVTGKIQSPNFPYKAAVSRFGNTEVYRLLTQTDTSVQQTFIGRDLKTGDLNGDGNMDLIVRKSGGSSNMDTIMVYWGTASGIDTISPTKLVGQLPQDGFGQSMAIGNIIGDATSDLAIAAPYYPGGNVIAGRVYLYQGGSPFPTQPTIVLNGDSARYTLGISCAIGDLNNDGHDDLAVRGWFQTGTPGDGFDYVNVWFGSAMFDTTRDMQLRSREINSTGLACFDANGDGIADLLWTNKDSLRWIYIQYGGSAFSTSPSLRLRDPQFAEFGTSIANAGDMNGDGYNDVLVGAYFSNNPGFVFVYGGGPNIDQYFDAAVGMSSLSYFGYSISSVGDVTVDGLADIIVGAPNYEFGNQRGYWGIFKGDSTIRVTDVREDGFLPKVMTLYQAYPNPFNPQTTIRYDLNTSATVTLEVFNLIGQRVTLLVNDGKVPGKYEAVFDGSGLASGAYLYRLTARTQDGRTNTDTKKLTLIK